MAILHSFSLVLCHGDGKIKTTSMRDAYIPKPGDHMFRTPAGLSLGPFYLTDQSIHTTLRKATKIRERSSATKTSTMANFFNLTLSSGMAPLANESKMTIARKAT